MPAAPEPIPDFPGFIASLLTKGYARNPCRDACQDKDDEHEHLRTPDGEDMIVWADGRWSPGQVREIQDWMDSEHQSGRISFKVLAIIGEELGVAEVPGG